MDNDSMEMLLANRSYLYALAARGYAEEIDAGFAELFMSGHAREELRLVDAEQTGPIASLQREIAAYLAGECAPGPKGCDSASASGAAGEAPGPAPRGSTPGQSADERALGRAAREYVRLFVGPGSLRADPWETVHLSHKRTLFQPGVLEVRSAYQQAGFLPVRYRQVPDDFIGIELDFMAKLAARALDEWSAGDASWRTALRQSAYFLERHLLRWVGSLADAIESEYGCGFYSRFTRLVALIAERDACVLAELLRS